MTERAAFLMPVYQAQEDFDDTMKTLEASTIPCTVFAVDDGSNPPLEARQYAPGITLRLIRLARNQGIVGALNAGLQAAIDAGFEFIARIDAGDYIRPDRLERQIEYMDAHPRCVLVGSDAEVRDETGAHMHTIQPPRDPKALARGLHERHWLLHPSVMYRASVFRQIGFYTDEFAAAEDFEMFLRIANRYEIGAVPEPLLVYIVRKGSISGRKARVQLVSRLRIQLRHFKWSILMSYYGVLKTLGTMLLPEDLKQSLKSKFLYTKPGVQAQTR